MDYHRILGVEKDATPEELKLAYKLKVKQFHPDKQKGDDSYFLLINEAYSALSSTNNPNIESNKPQGNKKSYKPFIPIIVIIFCALILVMLYPFMSYATSHYTYDGKTEYNHEIVSSDNPIAVIEIEGYGQVKIELFQIADQPYTDEFISYVENNTYNNIQCYIDGTISITCESSEVDNDGFFKTTYKTYNESDINVENIDENNKSGYLYMDTAPKVDSSSTTHKFSISGENSYTDATPIGQVIEGEEILNEILNDHTRLLGIPNNSLATENESIDEMFFTITSIVIDN